jgi:hypothetical protein
MGSAWPPPAMTRRRVSGGWAWGKGHDLLDEGEQQSLLQKSIAMKTPGGFLFDYHWFIEKGKAGPVFSIKWAPSALLETNVFDIQIRSRTAFCDH